MNIIIEESFKNTGIESGCMLVVNTNGIPGIDDYLYFIIDNCTDENVTNIYAIDFKNDMVFSTSKIEVDEDIADFDDVSDWLSKFDYTIKNVISSHKINLTIQA